jgi:hypothetical protein
MTQLIAEQLLLLAYRPDGTSRGKGTELDMALGGALLTELALEGYVELIGNRLAAIPDRGRPVHPELAVAFDAAAAKPRAPKGLVPKLAKGTRRRLLAGLVAAGVLTEQPRRVFGVFPGRRFPLADPVPRDEALHRLRTAVIDGQQPDQRTAALASLIQAARLGARIFPDDDRRAVKARLAELAEGDWAATAVRKAIQAAHAATVAAVTAASSASASASGS